MEGGLAEVAAAALRGKSKAQRRSKCLLKSKKCYLALHQETLEQAHRRKMPVIGTTIFSEKDVSMKYRGMFEVVAKRDDGRIIYTAKSGQWTLQEGFEWWKKNHAQMRASGGSAGGRTGASKDKPAKPIT